MVQKRKKKTSWFNSEIYFIFSECFKNWRSYPYKFAQEFVIIIFRKVMPNYQDLYVNIFFYLNFINFLFMLFELMIYLYSNFIL